MQQFAQDGSAERRVLDDRWSKNRPAWESARLLTRTCLGVLATVVLLGVSTRPLWGDDIVLKEVGDLPVARGKIHYQDKFIEAHVLLDMGSCVPLIIHARSVGGLDLQPRDAEGKEVDIEFAGGVRWKGIPVTVREPRSLEMLTARYARQLEEVPVVAVVGLPAMRADVVEFDLRSKLLRTMSRASDEARSQEEIDYESGPNGIVLSGTGPCKKPIKALLAMQRPDSILKTSLLKAARQAGEKPNTFEIGEVQFGEHTAFRFEKLTGVPRDVDAVLGMSIMRNFAVTAWPKRKRIAFVPHTIEVSSEEEQGYFFALADGDPEAVLSFIEKRPRRRLLDEACLALWQIRLRNPTVSAEALREALQTLAAHYDPSRCCDVLSRIADTMEADNPTISADAALANELAALALELAMTRSTGALNPTAVHGVHLRLGRKAFARGDIKEARRRLLSAAFGMPKNGECNFWLGEAYKALGKPRRAWSRYFQAILDPDIEPVTRLESLMRLDELNREPSFRKTFNMTVAEQYMAGRLEDAEFHAPSRYRFEEKRSSGHVRLVELFTDADRPTTGGMQLAFQALDEYFEGDIALIEYHLNDPLHNEAALDRLKYYDVKSAPLVVFDGTSTLTKNVSQAEKLSENAAANFDAFRDQCLLDEPLPDSGWAVDAEMAQDGSRVSATVSVVGQGETNALRLHAVLCERTVMAFPGNGVFFHHFVVREMLTPPHGVELNGVLENRVRFAVDAEQMRQRFLAQMQADSANVMDDSLRLLWDLPLETQGGRPEGFRCWPSYVDANKLMLVVFLQRTDDRRVLAVESVSLPQEDELL